MAAYVCISIPADTITKTLKKAFGQSPSFSVLSQQTMGFSGGKSLKSIARTNFSNFHHMEAGVAELSLDWSSSEQDWPDAALERPGLVFMKHIVIPAPKEDATAEELAKVQRDVQSYKNEFAIMNHLYPLMDIQNPAILHPRLFYYESDAQESGSYKFTVLSESMFSSGWTQVPVIPETHIDACLEWLARFKSQNKQCRFVDFSLHLI